MLLLLVKSVYSLLLPPACFVIWFGAASIWLFARTTHRRAAAVTGIGTVLFAIVSTPLFGSLLTHSLERQYVPPGQLQADSIVILTGGATLDTPNVGGSLGHAQSDTAARIVTAARLQLATGLPITVSGGQVFATTGNEGEIAQRELIGLGVPPERIRLDRTSRNTKENAINSAAILKQEGWSKPLLVTSAFHMPRSMAEFRQNGIDAIAYPTDYKVNTDIGVSLLSYIPSAQGMGLTALALKEYLGLLAIWAR
ncbi:YdcF family protein [Paenibacillus chartarius]|uniref:YdcF family protein n=1 Tax=Paenibacillus chartarius TaxID=747481 RepID=A0ABV6DN66_9BACL